MNIRVISVGRIKEKYLKSGIEEYLKRLQAYAKIEVIEVKDESFVEPLSNKNIALIKEKEAERIKSNIPERYFVIALDRKGKQLSSIKLAALLKNQGLYNQGNVVFIIGGALGLADTIIQSADLILSFSQLTFPHQLARLILMEQIYRSFTIIRNEKYHK